MTCRLDHRGWTADEPGGPCVICGKPAILRSPRVKLCHWTCTMAWVSEHQDKPTSTNTEQHRRGGTG